MEPLKIWMLFSKLADEYGSDYHTFWTHPPRFEDLFKFFGTVEQQNAIEGFELIITEDEMKKLVEKQSVTTAYDPDRTFTIFESISGEGGCNDH